MSVRSHSAAEARTSAFCNYALPEMLPRGSGPLSGLAFAVKDLFDIAGMPTGAGSPEWLATHAAASKTAPAIATLLQAGARLLGKTQTDELAYSLAGKNAHYGTPLNPSAPDRTPGGSSSGSASAAAAGLVDFAIGSDTGGSVRLPASFCGVYGIRTTHGRIATEHVVPLAPSFDTVGWFAREAPILEKVGATYFPDDPARAPSSALLLVEDAFEIASERVRETLRPVIARLSKRFSTTREVRVAPEGLDRWRETFRTLQAREVWSVHGAWIEKTRPKLGPGIAERFAFASTVDAAAAERAATVRSGIAARMADLLANGAVLCLPTAPDVAPHRDADLSEIEALRMRALAMLSIAGLASLPQISLPLGEVDGAPVGLSIVSARGTDRSLLALATALAGS